MKKLLLAIASLITWIGANADTSPNGKQYDSMVDGLYFTTYTYRGSSVKELVDADYTENMIIPDEVDGLKVERISKDAFRGRVDIESVVFNPSMKYMGDNAFNACKYLSHIDLSATENLNSGYYVFDECISLEYLEIPKGLVAWFRNCTGLKKVVFKDVSGSISFDGCSSLSDIEFVEGMTSLPTLSNTALTEVVIPASVKTIGNDIFNGCSKLSKVMFSDDSQLTSIGNYAFSGTCLSETNLPDGITTIGLSAFANTKITEFRMPLGLTDCSPNDIFTGCGELKRLIYNSMEQLLNLPPCLYQYSGLGKTLINCGQYLEVYIDDAPVTDLSLPGGYQPKNNDFSLISTIKKVKFENSTNTNRYVCTFYRCPFLESVEIGAGAQKLEQTFSDCPNLKSVIVSPKNRAELLHYAFSKCTSLESVSFPAVTTIYNAFNGCTNLKEVDLPALACIDTEAFSGCTALEEVNFPNATFNGYYSSSVFSGCTSLKRVYMPKVEELYSNTFLNCTSLSDLTLGNVTTIGEKAFYNCESLTDFDFSNVQEIGSNAFDNSGLTSIKLPYGVKVSGRFASLKNLRSFEAAGIIRPNTTSVFADYNLSDLESLEEVIISGPINAVYISNSFKKNPGRIILNDDAMTVSVGRSCDSLKSVNFRGDVENATFTECKLDWVSFKSVESYLNTNFKYSTNSYRTPAYQSDYAVTDFCINGNKVANLEIPSGSTVGVNAFRGMTFEKVTFMSGDEETTIDEAAFHGCTNLREVKFNGNVTSIGRDAFRLTALEYIELPECVSSLGMSCFQQNENLRHITFSPSIKNIPAGVMHNCKQIESVIFPEGTETLDYRLTTNDWNPSVRLISLPSTLKSLYFGSDAYTFDRLSPSVEVLCWATTPPAAGLANFDNNTVHVPAGYAEAYKASREWMNANILDDLILGSTLEYFTSEGLSLSIPDNNVADDARIKRCVVKVTKDGEEVTSYEFDVAGDGLSRSDNNGNISLFVPVPDVEPNTFYNYTVNGYTLNNDLIHVSTGVAEAKTSSISAVGAEGNAIAINNGVINIAPCFAGNLLQIYSADGCLVCSKLITESGQISLDTLVNSGIYIVRIGNQTVKVAI